MTTPQNPNSITFPDISTIPDLDKYLAEYRGNVLRDTAIAFIILELIAFGLRVAARRINRVQYGWDDALMILALLSNLAVSTAALLSVSYGGGGRHTLAVVQFNMHELVFMGKTALLVEPIAYTLAVTFSKGAILYFFLRIFHTGTTRYITYAVAVIVTAHAIAAILVSLFQCRPLSLLWAIDRHGCTTNITMFFRWNSIPHVITDITMFILPIPQVWSLRTSVRVKVGITFTFLTASVGIITSILRAIGFFNTNIFNDPTWASVPLLCYTIAEPGTLFLAACFKTYQPFLVRLKRRVNSRPHIFGRGDYKGAEADGRGLVVEREWSRGPTPKHAREFESVLLSNISRDISRTTIEV